MPGGVGPLLRGCFTLVWGCLLLGDTDGRQCGIRRWTALTLTAPRFA
jgi:hypothetical protein